MKKIITVLLAMLVLGIPTATLVSAAPAPAFTLRIEGISACFYYGSIPLADETTTLQAALIALDLAEDSLKISGADTGYIYDINGDSAGAFGGWDGWLYLVNDVDPMMGIDGYTLQNGDSVVLYFGDPFGVGMQFPQVDTSRLQERILTFTSSDTAFDEDFNPIITVNPVAGATVIWGYDSQTATYVTDENGQIQVAAAQLTPGTHSLQIEKPHESGLPLVLRFAPDFTVTVTTLPTTGTPVTTAAGSAPETGDHSPATALVLMATSVLFILAWPHKKNHAQN